MILVARTMKVCCSPTSHGRTKWLCSWHCLRDPGWLSSGPLELQATVPQGAENAESSIRSAVFCPGSGTRHFCCLLIDQHKPRGPTLPAGSPEVQSPPPPSRGSLTALGNSTSAPHTFRANIWRLISLLSSERAPGSFFHFPLDSLSFLFLRTSRDKHIRPFT